MALYYKAFLVESGDTIYPDLELGEDSLLAIITAILINPENLTIRLPDVTLSQQGERFSTKTMIRSTISSFKSHGNVGIFEVI